MIKNLLAMVLALGLVASLSLTLSSCATVAQFAPVKMGQIYPVRTQPAAIELFRSSTPTRKFVEVGTVNACCSSDSNAMIDVLRQKASENGGDGLIGLEINAHGGSSATVIRYQ